MVNWKCVGFLIRKAGLVEAIEVFADRDKDPAELWMIREDASDSLPTILDLRYGTESVLRLRVKSWKKVPTVRADGRRRNLKWKWRHRDEWITNRDRDQH